MRALVTGAAGFLGRKLVQRLAGEGHDVLAIDRTRGSVEAAKRVTWVEQDLADQPLEASAIAGIDFVFHLAGATLGARIDEAGFLRANEATTVRLLEACAASRPTILIASSQVVYGDVNRIGVTEEVPLDPTGSAYACSKVNCESWVRWFERRHGGRYLVLRFSGFVEGGGAVDYIIDRALKNEPIELFSQGAVRRDYLGTDRGIAAMMGALSYSGPMGVVPINIGSGQAIASRGIARIVCDEIGSSSAIVPSSTPAPQGDFVFDVRRAREYLGFDPGSLEDAVRTHARNRKAMTERGST